MYGGELRLGWTFSREMFDEASIQDLADQYAAELQEVIKHCVEPLNHGVTPADFPLAELSQAQLDALVPASNNLQDLYPLSPMQQGMLFHSLYEEGEAGATSIRCVWMSAGLTLKGSATPGSRC